MFLVSGLSLYALLVVMTLGLSTLQRVAGLSGVLGDLRYWFVLLWPYPFLLSLQRYVPNPAGNISFAAAYVFGFCLVAAWGLLLDRLRLASRLGVLAPPLAAMCWCVPLLTTQLVSIGIAALLGWPTGE